MPRICKKLRNRVALASHVLDTYLPMLKDRSNEELAALLVRSTQEGTEQANLVADVCEVELARRFDNPDDFVRFRDTIDVATDLYRTENPAEAH